MASRKFLGVALGVESTLGNEGVWGDVGEVESEIRAGGVLLCSAPTSALASETDRSRGLWALLPTVTGGRITREESGPWIMPMKMVRHRA